MAKRRATSAGAVEADIYEHVLPRLQLPHLRFYGRVRDADGYSWLFIEDAGDREFFPRRAEHRAMGARWLGMLHTDGAGKELQPLLRARGPVHYAEHLRAGVDRIRAGLGNPALRREDRAALTALLVQCDVVESRWQEAAHWCQRFPSALIHGDFVRKNVRLVDRGGSDVVIAFDWETAGWGSPAADLARLTLQEGDADLKTYRDTVRECWPDLSLADVRRWAAFGVIFWLMAAISWASRGLGHQWVARPMRHLGYYRDQLDEAISRVGWDA